MVSYDHSREVFHILDINEDDKDEADISGDKASVARESEVEKARRRKKRISNVSNNASIPNIAPKHTSDMKDEESRDQDHRHREVTHSSTTCNFDSNF